MSNAAAHELNIDAAQREIDRRSAEGEDMTGATICPRTYAIRKPPAVSEAVFAANSNLASAGLPTYSELLALLKEAQRVGLDLHIGRAYISRAYIDKQAELNARIDSATHRAGGAA